MSRLQEVSGVAPAITGPVALYIIAAGTGIGVSRTGSEYGGPLNDFQFVRLEGWGVPVPGSGPPPEDPVGLAARMARQSPFVRIEVPPSPTLTGNLVSDVREVSGLTFQEIAEVGGVTERTVQGWRERARVPVDKEDFLEALRAVGLTLYAGLGRDGVARWLKSGKPTPLDLVRRGKTDEVRRRVEAFRESIAS